MKTLVSMIAVLGITGIALGSSSPLPTGPLLVKKIGGIAHSGTVTTCEIFPNNPKISQRLDAIIDLIARAHVNGDLETIAQFAIAQIPTEEVYANRVVSFGPMEGAIGVQKVELVEAFGSMRARTSDEAKELIKLVDELCQ